MNSSFIDKCLHKKFDKHKYQISNAFIFNEESDFFSVTSTGYTQEIEVKVSRSDYLADFKKSKYNKFKQLSKGQEYVVVKGHIIYEVMEPIMQYVKGEDGKGILEEDKYGRKRPVMAPSGKYSKHTYSGGEDSWVKKREEMGCIVRALSTGVRIFKPILPNKFWYAVPENLITIDEVPEYAGLYYVLESGEIKTIKKAPFIHKEKHNLDKVLLDKFYYLCLRLKNRI